MDADYENQILLIKVKIQIIWKVLLIIILCTQSKLEQTFVTSVEYVKVSPKEDLLCLEWYSQILCSTVIPPENKSINYKK